MTSNAPATASDIPRWAFWIILAAALGLGAAATRLPPPKRATAPAHEFAAGRALADIRTLARDWHPIGSPANTRVRDALLARLEAMQLAPEVHVGVGTAWKPSLPQRVAMGTVHNIIALLRGRDRKAPAVLLMAHYDSTPASPGAADDIANVAAALEIARILQADPARERDVILLFTDGEEAGLLGGDAFFRDDPWREHVGVVVNLEARGDAGPANMFETSRDAGALVRLYAAVAPRPHAHSLAAFVYAVLPNDTDFTHALRHGLPGLNVAFIGDQLAYHTPLATPQHLAGTTLQHVGDQVLPVIRALAAAPALPAAAPDETYFDIAGRIVVAYPPAWGWAPLVLAAVLLVVACRGVARHPTARVDARSTAVACALALASVVAAALVLFAAGRVVVAFADEPVYREFGWVHAGAVLLGSGTALRVLGAARRTRASAWACWLGALALLFVLACVLQWVAPRAAAIYAWPLAIGAALAASLAWRPTRAAWAGAGLVAIVLVALLVPVEYAFFTALGPELPLVFALFLPPLSAVLTPYAHAAGVATRGGRRVAAATMLAGVAVLAAVAMLPARATRPAVNDIYYVAAADGKAQWLVTPRAQPTPWERQVLARDGGEARRAPLPPLAERPAWIAPATTRAVHLPQVSIVREGGRVVVHGRATGGGRVLTFTITSRAPLGDVRLGATRLPAYAPAGVPLTIRYAAPGPDDIVVDFAPGEAGAPVAVTLAEQRDGWPPGFVPPPAPANEMPWLDGDTTFALATAALP
ncbi:MAG: M28 family peptidase [Proteobacteria bacterium]|nr:M28 family peptidase [Pseudomonadota bacterium]